ncbi:T-cell surface glycoprotein CD3 epsilon chain-like [Chelmon rostratus]|uniref:T-cell surface glycoprotein CD3 epsilon chain-like n=1 Tax=Chelmon rostratus TaxID=109905 RepID=UPI001BE95ED0|nr:T-cell surface glycoprotein CD3 epsilon chain-like [Chelmon rostratus]
MTSMGIQAALAVLLLLVATVKADDGGVSFWGESCTMTCPEEGTWYYKNKNISEGLTYKFKYENDKKGLYRCEYDRKKYYFYVQGKVCENCYELDATLFSLALVADISVTAFVMMMIRMCIRKRSSAGLAHTPKAPARSGGRAPPVPSPDYEQLNTHTRSKDTYSVVNRTG